MKQYESYKESNLPSVGIVPADWGVVPIKYVLEQSSEGIKIGPFGSTLTGKVSSEHSVKVYGQWNVIGKDFTAGKNYVTEETYSLLPIKDAESIMIAPYPIYQEEFTFSSATILDDVIKFIVKVRNVKQEHQIPKDAKVYFKGDNADIILKLLKIDTESLVEDNNLDGIEIKDTNYEIKYIFDSSSIKEKEKENLLKEKERLEGAIKRRENLLSNENYVNKAPKNIVDLDRENLEKDKKELEIIMDKLNN